MEITKAAEDEEDEETSFDKRRSNIVAITQSYRYQWMMLKERSRSYRSNKLVIDNKKKSGTARVSLFLVQLCAEK